MDKDVEKFAQLLDEQAEGFGAVVLAVNEKERQIAALTAVYIFGGLAEIVRKMGAEPQPDVCPHPLRNGRHEVYLADGKTFCRACGKKDV